MAKTGRLMVAIAVLTLSSAAQASPASSACGGVLSFIDELFHITPECVQTPPSTLRAPEIDPASTISAMTLLLGGLIVLRGRKARA